jgi:chorismate mutase / prephenate dehydratase
MPDELDALRAQIDELDRRIVALLNERASLGLRAGRAKACEGRAVSDPTRELEVLARVTAANEGPIPDDRLLALYRALLETIRRLEETEATEGSPRPSSGRG